MVIVAVILRFATMCYPSTKQSNFIATPSKYFENLENTNIITINHTLLISLISIRHH